MTMKHPLSVSLRRYSAVLHPEQMKWSESNTKQNTHLNWRQFKIYNLKKHDFLGSLHSFPFFSQLCASFCFFPPYAHKKPHMQTNWQIYSTLAQGLTVHLNTFGKLLLVSLTTLEAIDCAQLLQVWVSCSIQSSMHLMYSSSVFSDTHYAGRLLPSEARMACLQEVIMTCFASCKCPPA